MASHHGKEGVVNVGANSVAEVIEWSVDEEVDIVDSTPMGTAAATYVTGTTRWNGSIKCFWDETDTNGQQALTIGASVTLNLYPEGTTSGDTYATGTALVTGISIPVNKDSMTERSFTFQGTGALTWGTVV